MEQFQAPQQSPGRKASLATLLQDSLARLPESLLASLETLAIPHWIDPRLVRPDALPEITARTELEALWLVEPLSGGQIRVAASVREFLLQRLARERQERYRALSGRYVKLLSKIPAPSVELYIETQYHRLAVDERTAAAQLFRDAVAVHTEPVFAFDTLRRLLETWREQARRNVLSDEATSYLRVAELFDPAARTSSKQQIALLRPIANARKITDPAFQAEVNMRLGVAEMAHGDISRSRAALESARAAYAESKIARGIAEVERTMGRLYLKIDRYDQAIEAFSQARDGFERLELKIGFAQCTKSIAEIHFLRGDLKQAAAEFQEAIGLFEEQDGRMGEANSRVVLAQLHVMRGDYEQGRRELDKARQFYESIDNTLGISNCLKSFGALLIETGDFGGAEHALRSATKLYEEWGSAVGVANATLLLGRLLIRSGSLNDAVNLIEEALGKYVKLGDTFGTASALRERAVLHVRQGQAAQALNTVGESRRLFEAIGSPLEAALSIVAVDTWMKRDGQRAALPLDQLAGAQRTVQAAGIPLAKVEAVKLRAA